MVAAPYHQTYHQKIKISAYRYGLSDKRKEKAPYLRGFCAAPDLTGLFYGGAGIINIIIT